MRQISPCTRMVCFCFRRFICKCMYMYQAVHVCTHWAGSTLHSRTVRQKEKKRSFVVLERRSIHKSCPRTHNPVLYLWRIVIMQGQWRIQRDVLGNIGKNNIHVHVYVYMYIISRIKSPSYYSNYLTSANPACL